MPGCRVLEPSCGNGALIDAIKYAAPEVELVGVELDKQRCDDTSCRFLASKFVNRNFLELGEFDLGKFHRVVMNPPFAPAQADIDHVTHAFELLRPGGRLVSIMSAGVTFRENRKAREFRELVDRASGEIHELPDESFKVSGTSVRTVLVVMNHD